MTTFTGFCIGVIACITTSILGEREYGRMMYRRGYSKALEAIQGKNEECNRIRHKWIPITEMLPQDESYILVSFENTTMPDIARYEENDEGGTFYPGDDEESYSSYGLFVNAWMELPEPYKEKEYAKTESKVQ